MIGWIKRCCLTALLFVAIGFEQPVCAATDSSYTLTVTIPDLDSAFATIQVVNETGFLDTLTARGDYFQFKGKIKEPVFAILTVTRGDKFVFREFFLEPGNIKVHSESIDAFPYATVSGTKNNTDWATAKKQLQAIRLNTSAVQQNMLAANITDTSSKGGPFMHFMGLQTIAAQNQYIVDYVQQNPNSFAALKLIYDYIVQGNRGDSLTMLLFNQLTPTVQQSAIGTAIASIIKAIKNTAVGAVPPAFSLKLANGRTVNLNQYKGKYVLIDFWASWCAPCRAENPNLLKAYKKYQSKGLDILSISIDEDRKDWQAAVKQDKLPWAQAVDTRGWKAPVAVDYGIKSIPANFLIGPDGKIIAKNLRGDELDKWLKQIFSKP
jgi:thiol-disulfide isomerase/thioredoxin